MAAVATAVGVADRTGRCGEVDGRLNELVREMLAVFLERGGSDWRKITAAEPGSK